MSENLAALSRAETLLPRLANEEDRTAYAANIAEERHAIHEHLLKRKRRY
jgi:hypothetical protein